MDSTTNDPNTLSQLGAAINELDDQATQLANELGALQTRFAPASPAAAHTTAPGGGWMSLQPVEELEALTITLAKLGARSSLPAELAAAVPNVTTAAARLAPVLATRARDWASAIAGASVDTAQVAAGLAHRGLAEAARAAASSMLTAERIADIDRLSALVPTGGDGAALRAAIVPSLNSMRQKIDGWCTSNGLPRFAILDTPVAILTAVLASAPDELLASFAALLPGLRLTAIAAQVGALEFPPARSTRAATAPRIAGAASGLSEGKLQALIVVDALTAVAEFANWLGLTMPYTAYVDTDATFGLDADVGVGWALGLYGMVRGGTVSTIATNIGYGVISVGTLIGSLISTVLNVLAYVLGSIIFALVV